MIACNWTPSYTLTVPSDWTSGVYGAMLTNDQGFQNFVMFVVKDGRPAPFLYQQSITTDQAYNDYPNDGLTGKSLYGFNSYGANTASGTHSRREGVLRSSAGGLGHGELLQVGDGFHPLDRAVGI